MCSLHGWRKSLCVQGCRMYSGLSTVGSQVVVTIISAFCVTFSGFVSDAACYPRDCLFATLLLCHYPYRVVYLAFCLFSTIQLGSWKRSLPCQKKQKSQWNASLTLSSFTLMNCTEFHASLSDGWNYIQFMLTPRCLCEINLISHGQGGG